MSSNNSDLPALDTVSHTTSANAVHIPPVNGPGNTERDSKADDVVDSSAGSFPAPDGPPSRDSPTGSSSIQQSKCLVESPTSSITSARDQTDDRHVMSDNQEGYTAVGSAFSNGAGTTGPKATPEVNESMHRRAASAEVSLTPKQKSKIVKAELKDGKSLSKIIKQESKVEKAAIAVAIKELGELQELQKAAIKREAKAHTAHSKVLAAFQKHEVAFLAARTKYEAAQAELKSEAETLDISRTNAREATEAMQEKSREVDSLRTTLGVDEREREVKLVELSGKKSTSRWR